MALGIIPQHPTDIAGTDDRDFHGVVPSQSEVIYHSACPQRCRGLSSRAKGFHHNEQRKMAEPAGDAVRAGGEIRRQAVCVDEA